MQLQLANFIRGRLAANITAASTSIPLTAAAFPALAGGAVCYAVLQSAADRSVVEIVKVTAGGATLTVERGQEGTVARAFAANDIIEQRLTAGQFQNVVDHSNTASAHVPAGVAGKFLKGVQDGAPVWGMPTAQDVGALPIVGGVLTGTHPITLDTSLGAVTAASFAGSLSGNAASATKWAAARTLSWTGHAVGSMSVDGSGNASAALTLAASGIAAGTYKSVTFDTYGRATAGTNPTTLAGYGITDALPLTGKAADSYKLDGISSAGFGRAYSSWVDFGGSLTACTTAEFITLLTNMGAFAQPYWVAKASWAYSANYYITDTGCGIIQLAGATVEVIGGTGAYTIRIHTAPTGSVGGVYNADFIYVNHGADYAPTWHRSYSTANKPSAADVGALSLSGNAASATKWAAARTLSWTGHAVGSMSVDGSGNASAALTLAASGIAAGTYKSVTFDTYGRATAGTNPTTLAGYGITDALPLGGNAASATKLIGARMFSIGSSSKAFDGTKNVSWSAAEINSVVAAACTAESTNVPAVGSIALVARIIPAYASGPTLNYGDTVAGSTLKVASLYEGNATQACTGTWKVLSFFASVPSGSNAVTQYGLAIRIE